MEQELGPEAVAKTEEQANEQVVKLDKLRAKWSLRQVGVAGLRCIFACVGTPPPQVSHNTGDPLEPEVTKMLHEKREERTSIPQRDCFLFSLRDIEHADGESRGPASI